ncbi:hypothetical protein CON49_03760, partial [Bacillus cereus]
FRISIKNNEKLHGKIRLCINIFLKLMDVGYRHMPIKRYLKNVVFLLFYDFLEIKKLFNYGRPL